MSWIDINQQRPPNQIEVKCLDVLGYTTIARLNNDHWLVGDGLEEFAFPLNTFNFWEPLPEPPQFFCIDFDTKGIVCDQQCQVCKPIAGEMVWKPL